MRLTDEVNFDQQGLVPVVVQEEGTGQVLMVAYMNREALEKTLETGRCWFFSRSREQLWMKGETSGHVQQLEELRVDCDGDCLLAIVHQKGPGACHTGHRSCFYRRWQAGQLEEVEIRTFEPREVYGTTGDTDGGRGLAGILSELETLIATRRREMPEGSYTTSLFADGLEKIMKKFGEEAVEVLIAAGREERDDVVYETGDLFYHLLVLLAERGISLREVAGELRTRRSGE